MITEYSAVTDRRIYEELADVIREKTGITETITPEEMPTIIRGINHVENIKRWDCTVDATSKTTTTLVSNDEWLKENYQDSRLTISVMYNGTTDIGKMFVAGTQSNSPVFRNGTSEYYGYLMQTNDNLGVGYYQAFGNLYSSRNQIRLKIGSDGNLMIISTTDTYTIKAGDYIVVAWLI